MRQVGLQGCGEGLPDAQRCGHRGGGRGDPCYDTPPRPPATVIPSIPFPGPGGPSFLQQRGQRPQASLECSELGGAGVPEEDTLGSTLSRTATPPSSLPLLTEMWWPRTP